MLTTNHNPLNIDILLHITATPFPKSFMQSVKVIFTRLFRIFAIVYYHHYGALEAIGAVGHLNTSFKHFIFFIWEFDLVSEAEQEALADIIKEIKVRYAGHFPQRVRTTSNERTSSGGLSVSSSGKWVGGDHDSASGHK